MSETPETQETCEAKGGTWNAEAGTCTLPPKEPTAEKGLMDRLLSVMEEAFEAKLAAFELKIDAKLDSLMKAKEIEVEQALRKGMGLDTSIPLTTADVPSLIDKIRKAALETAPPQGKTPLPKEKGTPTEEIVDSFDVAVKAKLEGMN